MDLEPYKEFTTLYPGSDKPKVSIELEIEKLTDSELAKGYDVMLGEGTFDTFTVYADIPDINAWLNAFFDLYNGIADQLNEFKEEQTKNSQRLKQK
ncbi:hypothetical protein [Enterococcus faecalis]|uniref:hypothetical protein n=1 Tax=Enterococcus faecalis TaxID=1351 RepID=UPI003DA095DD